MCRETLLSGEGVESSSLEVFRSWILSGALCYGMTLFEQGGGSWGPAVLRSSPNHSGISPLIQKWESRGGTGSPGPRPCRFHGTVWDMYVITGKQEFLLYRGKYVVVSVLREAEALCALNSD